MAPSTPKRGASHQRKKRTRAELIANQRRTKQDKKATPKRKKKPMAVITQDDSPPVSILTTPASVPTSSTPSSTNKGIEALLIRHGMEGATQPVKIDDNNILGWFRDNAEVPGKGSPDSVRRGAKNLFEVIHYSNKGSSASKKANSVVSQRLSNKGMESAPLLKVQEHIPVSGISPLRRLLLEDICLLPVDEAMLCVLAVSESSPFYEYNRTLRNRVDSSERLPMFYCRDTCFVQMRVRVIQNRNRSLFESSKTITGEGVDRSLFTHLMLDHGNAQIGVEYLGVHDETRFLNIKDFFLYPASFQLWACLSYRRNFRDALQKKKNKPNRLRLFRRLCFEVYGDVATTLDVCSAYDAVTPRENVNRKPAPVVEPIEVLKTLPLAFYNEDIDLLSKWSNTIIAAEVERCYGSFISWTSSILSEACLDELQAKTFRVCAVPLAAIVEALGYGPKMGETRNVHRVKMYERTVMYLFFSIARVRNPKLFSMWALIGAAVFYGSTRRASARYASVLFGHACHSSTLMRLTKPYRDAEAFWPRVKEALKTQVVQVQFTVGTRTFYVTIYTFDNAQKNYAFKFQRDGKTSNFVKVTARLFISLWQGPWRNFVFHGNPHVIITYVDQAIPSPVGMKFKYETVDMKSSSDVLAVVTGNPNAESFEAAQAFQGKQWSEFTKPDFSGKRVSAYFRFIQVAGNLSCIYKHLSLAKTYAFEPVETTTNPFRTALVTSLSTQRGKSSFLHRASSFQRRSVLAYRGLRPKVEFLPMPVLRDDETTKAGIGGVVTKSLFRCGNLVVNPAASLPDEPSFVAHADIDSKWALIFCDGLSYERWRAYLKEIMDLQENMTYTKHYRLCREILKAAERAVLCPGDLHLTLFHTLSPIYKIFYGSFIQPFKVALGMKRIDWQHVEKCFEQSSLLVLLLLGRVEPRLMDVFVCSIGEEPASDPDTIDGARVAHRVAVEFDEWLDNKIAHSNDPWFRVICHFTKMARHYRLFKQSLRNGCPLSIEYLLLEFSTVFAAIGKPKCLESTLSMIEEWYDRIPYWMLQVIRDNRTAKLYDGRRRDHVETAERPNDELIELNNAAFTQMDFPPSTAAWETHSKNVSLVKRASMFVESQYRRKQDVDAQDAFNAGITDTDTVDTTNRKKASTQPSDMEKKKLIDEMLTLSGVLVETPNRALDPQLVWGIIGDVTTELKKEEDTASGDCGEEELLSNVYNEMHDVRFANTSGGEMELEEQQGINIVPDADAQDEAEGTVSDDEVDDEVAATNEGDQIVVGKTQKKMRVAKIEMSKFADSDTYATGHRKLSQQDLPVVRRRRKRRQTRERKALHDNLFEFQMGIGDDFQSVMNRLQRAMTEPERPHRCERYTVAKQLSG